MLHRTARLTPFGRRLLVERILIEGWPPATAAETLGVSRATAYKWLRRYRGEGAAGLEATQRPMASPRWPAWRGRRVAPASSATPRSRGSWRVARRTGWLDLSRQAHGGERLI